MTDQVDEKLLVSLQEDGLEEFLLHGHRQICQLLQELISSHALISVHVFPSGLSFLSAIVMLSEDKGRIFLDTSQSEAIHRRCLQADRLLCVTQLNKIRIQFWLLGSTEASVEGRPTLTAPIPSEILRLQRRDTFRLQVPLSHALKCILPVQEHEGEEKGTGKKDLVEAPVIDISAGGLSVEIPSSPTAPAVGDQINDCTLKLPGDLVNVNLEVRNLSRRIPISGKEILRLGCRFIALPTQTANQIQRYIYRVERELRAYET